MNKEEFEEKLNRYVALHKELAPYVGALKHRGFHTVMWNIDSVTMTGVNSSGNITYDVIDDYRIIDQQSEYIEHLVDWFDKSTCIGEDGRLTPGWEHYYG